MFAASNATRYLSHGTFSNGVNLLGRLTQRVELIAPGAPPGQNLGNPTAGYKIKPHCHKRMAMYHARMIEDGLEKRQHPRQLTDHETQLKEFVGSREFDKLARVESLKPGDRVVIRNMPVIGTVHEVKDNSVLVNVEERNVAGRKTINLEDVRRAEDYEKALREK